MTDRIKSGQLYVKVKYNCHKKKFHVGFKDMYSKNVKIIWNTYITRGSPFQSHIIFIVLEYLKQKCPKFVREVRNSNVEGTFPLNL